jgi:hypothetical protein
MIPISRRFGLMALESGHRLVPKAVVFLLAISAVIACAALFIGCSSGSSVSTQSPGGGSTSVPGAVQPETNPPGDIPDNQVFVSYHSDAGGYSLDVPEGWARTESGPNVSFVDKLDTIAVEITSSAGAPTVDSVEASEVPQLTSEVEAFQKVEVKALDLPAGKAVRIRYRANSAPDSVTGKKVRLEIDRYELFKDGNLAVISLSAPAGSDNVDVWNQISSSFKWTP